jgi:hypothetical protein
MAQFFQDRVEILIDLIVGPPYNTVPKRSKRFGARLVTLELAFVYWAVKFHNQAALQATKIDDKPIDRVLTAKLEAGKLAIAQCAPKRCFGLCLFLSQLARLCQDYC